MTDTLVLILEVGPIILGLGLGIYFGLRRAKKKKKEKEVVIDLKAQIPKKVIVGTWQNMKREVD